MNVPVVFFPHPQVYVVLMMNDFGTVNFGLGVVLPTSKRAGGSASFPFVPSPSVGQIWPSVHDEA
jgi:hypothetical protein